MNQCCVIRFLPALVKNYHSQDTLTTSSSNLLFNVREVSNVYFKRPTLKELNSRLHPLDADKETARNQKRRLHHVVNILVISDPANRANVKSFYMTLVKKSWTRLWT